MAKADGEIILVFFALVSIGIVAVVGCALLQNMTAPTSLDEQYPGALVTTDTEHCEYNTHVMMAGKVTTIYNTVDCDMVAKYPNGTTVRICEACDTVRNY